MKEGITIIPITKSEAIQLEKLGYHYHGQDADLNKTRNSRHYWIAERAKIKAALYNIRDNQKK